MPRLVNASRCLFIPVLLLVAAAAVAQDEETPKGDVFVGYQWLDTRATLPTSSTQVHVEVPPPPGRLPNSSDWKPGLLFTAFTSQPRSRLLRIQMADCLPVSSKR